MAALLTQTLGDTGAAPTFGAASTSDTAEIGNGRNTFVVYRNSQATTEDVTVVVAGDTDYGEPLPQKVVTVPAIAGSIPGESWILLHKEYDDGTGRATLTLTDATTVTVAVVRVG